MKKNQFLSAKKLLPIAAVIAVLVVSSQLAEAQALTAVANKIKTDATSAKGSVDLACKALCAIFIVIGVVGAAWKATTEHNDGAKAWGKWLMTSTLIGLAFGLLSMFF